MDELTVQWLQSIAYDNYHEERFIKRTNKYVKEVANVLELGIINVEQTRALYEGIIHNFGTSPDPSDTQQSIYNLRKNDRNTYHYLIDDVCQRFDPRLNWRVVKFEPKRVKRCAVCYSYYYDFSRNGRLLTCNNKGVYRRYDLTNRKYYYRHKDGSKLSECAVEYDKRRRAAPPGWTEQDIIYPPSGRRVQEVLIDMQTEYRY